jgi:hypothetical protein
MGARIVISLEGSIVSELQLTKPVTVVGRHPDCDVVIDHPAISARHMLFRIVGRTVYAEDLASTNGTRVNGLGTSHHVVHHLDLIEIGRHKLHFFDEELLNGKVQDLENTVFNQYEQTVLVGHVPAAVRNAAAKAVGEDIDRTMAITRPGTAQLGPMSEKVATQGAPANDPQVHAHGHNASRPLALRGDDGDLVRLDRANTMIGRIGRDTALIIRRHDGFFIARLSGRALRLNRAELGPGTHPIAERDVIDVGSSTFEVIAAT